MSSMERIAAERRAVPRVALRAAAATGAVRVTFRPLAEGLDALAAEWDALAAEAAEPNVFLERWFVAASLRNLAGDSEIRLAEARRGGRLIGLLPLTVETGYAHLPVRFVQNWYHDHCFLGTPLVAAGEESGFWAALLEALDAADWAPNFLHLRGISEDGPVHRGLARGETVHRRLRACLHSELLPEAYFEQAVRGKKRKELRRQRNRLAELGTIESRVLEDGAELDAWCDAYFALERKGWKGRGGSGLACADETGTFFREALAGAWTAGRLQFRRLDLDGRPLAMLANFIHAPGSFSFKTAFDEEFARFSPGVLLQIENLGILGDPAIAWMDSCAIDRHPMIDAFWRERRSILRLTIPLKGARRNAVRALCRGLERASGLMGRPKW